MIIYTENESQLQERLNLCSRLAQLELFMISLYSEQISPRGPGFVEVEAKEQSLQPHWKPPGLPGASLPPGKQTWILKWQPTDGAEVGWYFKNLNLLAAKL